MSSESKKTGKKTWIIWVIAAAVAVAGLTVGAILLFGNKGPTSPEQTGSTESVDETDEPIEDAEIQLFWNVERLQYAGRSEAGTSSRTPDKQDGYYHLLFSVNGRQVSRRCADKKLVNRIDNYDLLGLVFDEKGLIVGIRTIEEFTEGFEYFGLYVSEVREDGTVVMNSAANLDGLIDYEDRFEDAKFYDVSGSFRYIGEEMRIKDLTAKDRLFAVKDNDGVIRNVFVTEHFSRPKLYWNITRYYDQSIASTTRTPNSDLLYEFDMACDGEQIKVYVRSPELATAIDARQEKIVGLEFDQDGIVSRVKGFGVTLGGKSFASWWVVTEVGTDGSVTARKISTGEEDTAYMAADCRIFDVSGAGAFIGEEVDAVKPGDQIQGCTGSTGELLYIFIVGGRTKDSPLYWNMKRYYNSTTKETTRTPNAAGYYVFDLAVDGTVKQFKTKDKAIATKIDSYAAKCFGLQLDESGEIIDVYTQKATTGGSSTASWYTITKKIDDKTFEATKISKTASDAGKVVTVKLADDCKVTNVSGVYNVGAGEYTTLQVGDQVHGAMNILTETVYIFVINRTVDLEPYWNVSRYYNSTTKQTTRTPGEDGYYSIKMITGGREVTVRTNNKAIASEIDSHQEKTVGLLLNGDIIVKVYEIKNLTKTKGGYTATWYKVGSVSGNVIHTFKESDPSVKLDVTMASGVEIYNVGGEFTKRGEKTTVQVGDKIHPMLNGNGDAAVIFIVERQGKTRTASCPVCGKSVTWTSYSGTFKAGAEGEIIHMYLAGNRNIASQSSTPENGSPEIHFDMNGYTLSTEDGARTIALFGRNSTLRIFDMSSKKSGVIKSGTGRPNDVGSVLWIRYGTGKLYIQDIILDFSAMDQEGAKGGLLVNANATAELKNVTIKAGHALGGAAIWSNGNLVLDNVTVTGGVNEQYGSVYISSTGTLKVSGKTSVSGGKLTNGEAANVFLDEGRKITAGEELTSPNGSIGVTACAGEFTAADFSAYQNIFTPDAPTATITVAENGALQMNVTVTGISFDPDTITVQAGVLTQLEPVISPQGASSAKLVYEVSDPTAVSVDEGGKLLGLKEASGVTVTAKTEDGTVSGTLTVTVTAPAEGTHYHALATTAAITAGQGNRIVWTAWEATDSLPMTSGQYYLTADVSLSDQALIPAGSDIMLCLNGHTVTAGAAKRVFSLSQKNIHFAICDCSSGETGRMTGSAFTDHGGLTYVANGSTLDIYGGTLTGSSTTKNGGIVYVNNTSTMTIYGGTLSGGSAPAGSGGNIFVLAGGTLKILGGTVKDGSAMMTGWHVGGNIYGPSGSTISIENATISGGRAAYGGNLTAGGELTVKNTTISGGTAALIGGNVFVDVASVVTMEDVVLVGGKAEGSGAVRAGNLLSQAKEITLRRVRMENGSAPVAGNAAVLAGTVLMESCTFAGGTASSGNATADLFINQSDNASAAALDVTIRGGSFAGTTTVGSAAALKLEGAITWGNESAPGLRIQNETATQQISAGSAGLSASSAIYVTAEKEGVLLYGGKDALAAFHSPDYTVKVSGNNLILEKETPPVQASHAHCVCGLTVTTAGQTNSAIAAQAGHVCSDTAWYEWTSTSTLPTYQDIVDLVTAGKTAADGIGGAGAKNYFFLSSNVALTSRWIPGYGVSTSSKSMGGTQIILCLNGHTVSCTDVVTISAWLGTVNGTNYSFNVADLNLTVTDCKGSGELLASSVADNKISGALLTSGAANTTLTLYGGSLTAAGGSAITGGTQPYGGGLIYLNKDTCTVNIYGGTVTGGVMKATGGAVNGGNIYTGGTVNMYGGTVSNGSLIVPSGKNYAAFGGNVFAKNFNMYGGTVTGGRIENSGSGEAKGGNVYASGAMTIANAASFVTGGVVTHAVTDNGNGTYTFAGTGTLYGGNLYSAGAATVSDGARIADGRIVTCATNNYFAGGNAYFQTGAMLSGAVFTNGTIEKRADGKNCFGGSIATFSGAITIQGSTSISNGQIIYGTGADGAAITSGERKGGNIGFGGKGSLTMTGGSITGGAPNAVRVDKGTLFTMTGGEIRTENTTAVFVNIADSATAMSRFELSGGTIFSRSENAVYVNGASGNISGTFVMTGGTLTSETGNALRNAGHSEIGGGTIRGNIIANLSDRTAPSGITDPALYNTYVKITGGYFTNPLTFTSVAEITGGYFTAEVPADKLKAGYVLTPLDPAVHNTDTSDGTEYTYTVTAAD